MKKSLLATAVLGALVAAAGAQATTVKLSGQVNRMIYVPDDAIGDEISFVDNTASGSRFRVTGAHDLGNGVEAGFRLEYQIQANGGFSANGGTTGVNNGGLDPRYADIYFKGNFGQISLGKGDDASDGITEADLSGTFLSGAGSVATTDITGGLVLNQAGSPGGLVRAVDVFSIQDGFGRTNRLRYDTPTFAGGLAFAASIGQGSSYAVKGTYNGNVGIGDLALAVGYADSQDLNTNVNAVVSQNDREILGASASLLFNFGVSITAAYSDVDADDQDGADITGTAFDDATKETSYVKLGYKFGVHALAIDYGVEERDGGEDGNVYGIGYVATPVSGVELYAGYRVTETDDDSYEEDSVNALLIGSRVKF